MTHNRVSYCYYYINFIGYVTFNTASYLEDANVVFTVQWIANPPVPIRNNVYRTVVSICSLKNTGTGMVSSVRRICALGVFFASCCSKDQY
jgi:hypothetical protein